MGKDSESKKRSDYKSGTFTPRLAYSQEGLPTGSSRGWAWGGEKRKPRWINKHLVPLVVGMNCQLIIDKARHGPTEG